MIRFIACFEPWPTFLLEIGTLLHLPKCEGWLMRWERVSS